MSRSQAGTLSYVHADVNAAVNILVVGTRPSKAVKSVSRERQRAA
ncbi:hypothetical protein SAMN02927900_02910 [Rhizobium mongolense subsp. loessense]|uniref:Transposase n=1 Tax=Rhizobium mongolense subsp. loessense TaxID=158890 RepID=A0A1G4RMK4_9HYPH|nr:hypothetical protein [Rhizobium mongolense]SCW58223.1 hypothetical protein SAMN02927900_02910 [Rhizobium mongolense subsp. loessense]